MRPDQAERLNDLSDRLAEQTLIDADPANWTAAGKIGQDMTPEERGAAVWDRKLAVQTVSLLMRIETLRQAAPVLPPGAADDPESDIRRAEKEAARLVEQHLTRYAPAE